jgi:hypothetical protein
MTLKAVAWIRLALWFADGRGLRHGNRKVEPFSGDGRSPAADISARASLLVEIALIPSASSPFSVPAFVSRMIEEGKSLESQESLSFPPIVQHLRENRIEIMAGVDFEEVSAFVGHVESVEQSGNSEEMHPV